MAINDNPRYDTNVLHFKVLKPLLRDRLGINALRIDELHHNENIDIRLLREIDRSDLLIADLTYERPSVYLEAGYALGQKKPVVYTCRFDHFSRQSQYQVHFDLRQKNILQWKSPTDPQFAKLLIARLRETLAPTLRKRETDEQERREQEQFLSLSPESRSTLLDAAAGQFLRKHRIHLDLKERDLYPFRLRGYRLHGTVRETVEVHVFPAITKGRLAHVWGWTSFYPVPVLKGMRSTLRHKILVSEGTATRARVEAVFREYALTGPRTWAAEPTQDAEGRPDQAFLHVIDGVRSVPMLKRQLELLSPHVFPR